MRRSAAELIQIIGGGNLEDPVRGRAGARPATGQLGVIAGADRPVRQPCRQAARARTSRRRDYGVRFSDYSGLGKSDFGSDIRFTQCDVGAVGISTGWGSSGTDPLIDVMGVFRGPLRFDSIIRRTPDEASAAQHFLLIRANVGGQKTIVPLLDIRSLTITDSAGYRMTNSIPAQIQVGTNTVSKVRIGTDGGWT